MKRIVIIVTVLLLLLNLAVPVFASDPYLGYSYSSNDEGTIDVAAPQAYLPAAVYSSIDLGVELASPEDLLFDS